MPSIIHVFVNVYFNCMSAYAKDLLKIPLLAVYMCVCRWQPTKEKCAFFVREIIILLLALVCEKKKLTPTSKVVVVYLQLYSKSKISGLATIIIYIYAILFFSMLFSLVGGGGSLNNHSYVRITRNPHVF
jgi:hypothetical protein